METINDGGNKKFVNGIIKAASDTLMDEQKKHAFWIEKLRNARERFFRTGKIDPCVREEIAASWKYCRRKHLDHENPQPVSLKSNELRNVIERNEYLIRMAEPVMHMLQEKLSEGGCLCMAYITDENGVILAVATPTVVSDTLKEEGFGVGAVWSEDSIGTNAVGLALKYGRDFSTLAPEHFMDDHAFINCSTSLIHGSGGNLVGTITVSYSAKFNNDLIGITVSLAAQSIERQLINSHDVAIINFAVNELTDGVMILNSDAEIIQINRKMRHMLKDPHVEAGNLDIRSLFKDIRIREINWGNKSQITLGETFLSYKRIYLRVRLDIYRIGNNGMKDGYVIFCRDISDLLKLSQQVSGSETRFQFEDIITGNEQMKKIIDQCRYIADQNMPVLIEGESGTGKEMMAQSIHSASRRAGKPFIAVNCAALPINLVESELFGYEKGTFTDGLATGKAGKFEMADGGTIFLDEIGELPLDVQAKLLRVLDSYKITRIGGKYEKSLDIRVIAATNKDLRSLVHSRSFREDLYYRINVMTIFLPPLSERKEDIPLLADHFVRRLNMDNKGPDKYLAPDTLYILEHHTWQGNVRELQNAVTRAYYLCDSQTISHEFLSAEIVNDTIQNKLPASETVPGELRTKKESEKDLIIRALEKSGWNISKAARAVDISRTTMYRKIKEYHIEEA